MKARTRQGLDVDGTAFEPRVRPGPGRPMRITGELIRKIRSRVLLKKNAGKIVIAPPNSLFPRAAVLTHGALRWKKRAKRPYIGLSKSDERQFAQELRDARRFWRSIPGSPKR